MPSHVSLRPRSVAVIGASADPARRRDARFVPQKHDFAGEIYRSTRGRRIGDLACYPDIGSLPAVPDVGIVLLGAERAHVAVRELAARGTAAAIVLASGYGETGDEGPAPEELMEAAGKMRILGPNTIGLVNLTDNITLSATGALEMDHFPAGPIAVISQSGGILGALLSRAAARGIGLSKLVSTSNEVDLELSDFIDHLADGRSHIVIALYVEAVRHPADFARPASRRAGRQAGRRIQDRTFRGRRQLSGVAYGRNGRLRSHVRRVVQAARRDPRANLHRPSGHSGRARSAASCAASAWRTHLDRRRGNARLRQSRGSGLRDARAGRDRRRRSVRCKPGLTPRSTAIRST